LIYRIEQAIAHSDHTVTVTWSDGVTATIDLAPAIATGPVFASLRDTAFFVRHMSLPEDRLGLAWPGRIDFSADGLRSRAFPGERQH
jgi:hypothetical protein